MIQIKLINQDSKKLILDFLWEHQEYCMFLLSNIKEFGGLLGESPNSGNTYYIENNKKIEGVFYLARRGNLLVHLLNENHIDQVIEHLQSNEKIEVSGVLGQASQASSFYNKFKIKHKLEDLFLSDEILYSIKLDESLHKVENVNYFPKDKIALYLEFVRGFYNDQNLPDTLDDETRAKLFNNSVDKKTIWSLKEDNEIVSMAAMNAMYENIGQVGGVYTPKEHRSRGFSKKCMRGLLYDCFHQHKLQKIILFTGNTNIAAQKVYEAIGFKRIGRYGMFFGKRTS